MKVFRFTYIVGLSLVALTIGLSAQEAYNIEH